MMAESIDIPPLTSTSTNLQKLPGASLHQQTTAESPTSQNQQRFLAPPQHHTPDSVLHLLSSVLPFLSGPHEFQLQPVALAQLGSLSVGLRQVGNLLEKNHVEALDCLHLHLINFCQNSSVDVLLRLQLLEIVELRTLGWQSNPLINAYYKQRFMDFDLKKLKVDSHANVGPVLVGPGIKNLTEGNYCNPAGAALETCNIINQFEATSSKSERPSDIILNNCKQPVGISCSRGTEPAPSSSSSNHSGTLDTESFHTVCNDSSSASIVVETNPTQPCSINEPCKSLAAAEKQLGASEVDDISSALKACSLNICGVVLAIQSADSAAVYKAKEALGQFIAKGNELKVLRRSREEILRLAASPFSQLPPQDWENVALSLPQAVIHGRERKGEKEVEGVFSSFRRVPERKTRRGEASAVPLEVRKEVGCTIITRSRLTPPPELPSVKSKSGKKQRPRIKRRPRNVTI